MNDSRVYTLGMDRREGLKARDVIAWVEGAPATEAQIGVAKAIQACKAGTTSGADPVRCTRTGPGT